MELKKQQHRLLQLSKKPVPEKLINFIKFFS